MKKSGLFFRWCNLFASAACATIAFCAVLSSAACAEELDWSPWCNLPVFYEGRIMPLDTFARDTIETICGSANPTFYLDDVASASEIDKPEYAEARKLFVGGKSRKFSSEELLFSWLVEPEKWERVPFLAGKQEKLRVEVLKIPVAAEDGRRLLYVSLATIENNIEFQRRAAMLDERTATEGKNFTPDPLDRQITRLADAYQAFRVLTFRPGIAEDPRESESWSPRFALRLRQAGNALLKMATYLEKNPTSDADRQAMDEATKAFGTLMKEVYQNKASVGAVGKTVAAFREKADAFVERFGQGTDKAKASLAFELAHQVEELQISLYDGGFALRLAPGLNGAAMEENRRPEDDARPWLALQVLLAAPSNALPGYPMREIDDFRGAFREAADAYLAPDTPDKAKKFHTALVQLADALQAYGKAVKPLRQKTPVLHRDENLLAATAYPPPGASQYEVFYNRFDPFRWSWILNVVAVPFFLLALGKWRKPLFWFGMVLLFAAQGVTLLGFALRMKITGFVPLAGMYETILFVSFGIGVFAMWLTLLPAFSPGMKKAWKFSRTLPSLPLWIALAGGLFYYLAWLPGQNGSPYFPLLPKHAADQAYSLDGIVVWLLGLAALLAILFYVPRFVLMLFYSVATVPLAWKGQPAGAISEKIMERRIIALVGAFTAFLFMLIACYSPPSVVAKGLNSPMPILRDNFWLTAHVLTIMASYAAGALAWGLGNVALGGYLFGRYTEKKLSQTATGDVQNGLSQANASLECDFVLPELSLALSDFIYKTIQVAVILLAAGTILGALWADVAWGRFWGWDPKEVWALVSLLAYMVILHARHIGWTSHFGLAVSTVLGFTTIVMAWYGVNFVLGSGKHAYAAGAGGQIVVLVAVLTNWLFVFTAAQRYAKYAGKSLVSREK